ncbi:hypothetical protein [Microtetraspora malaysiensis]|uniref:hypothetical protein n=1 Tax=Microtetraspora malaysiensis TaxID=161358 RepID=UPI0012FC8DEF|nr:hypothetical protein [Microtetraspora malaysiensis]
MEATPVEAVLMEAVLMEAVLMEAEVPVEEMLVTEVPVEEMPVVEVPVEEEVPVVVAAEDRLSPAELATVLPPARGGGVSDLKGGTNRIRDVRGGADCVGRHGTHGLGRYGRRGNQGRSHQCAGSENLSEHEDHSVAIHTPCMGLDLMWHRTRWGWCGLFSGAYELTECRIGLPRGRRNGLLT